MLSTTEGFLRQSNSGEDEREHNISVALIEDTSHEDVDVQRRNKRKHADGN